MKTTKTTNNNCVGIVETQSINIDTPLTFENGYTLNAHTLAYETYGELNAEKTNAILICHALSGNQHAAGRYKDIENSTGWWNELIGPGKVIDTNKFFVVCTNNLGGCHGSTGPNSINPETGDKFGPDFPIVTVSDWVSSQALFSDALGIDTWAAIVGGSLGGMQAIEWSIKFPNRIKHAVVIASAAKLSAQNIGFNEVARQAIRRDPEFHAGRYFDHDKKPVNGLRVARMLGHITYLSDDMMAEKFGRALQDKESIDFDFSSEFEVESYLNYQGQRFAEHFDANTYLLMTKALDYFDPAKEHQDNLSHAFKTASADFMVVSFTSDWRFSPQRSREIVKALQDNRLNVSYAEVEAPQGHDAFLMQIEDYIDVLKSYMKRVEV